MSVTQLGVKDTELNPRDCPRCGAALPVEAAFCNNCGERLDSMKSLTALLEQEEDIAMRYRITSLVRRRPLVNLYFALDFQQTASQGRSRMVAIRDLNLTALGDAALIEAVKLAQQEYDLLRRSDIPHLASAIELRFAQGHLFLVANQHPTPSPLLDSSGGNGGASDEKDARLTTLQDYLQSGRGLPSAQQALRWIEQLCETVHRLHQRHITIGDLDPFAILYNGDISNPGAADLALLISWMPPEIRALLPMSSQPTSSFFSYFVAPEVGQGAIDARSDVYSLGAILYLLLTGTPPGESTLRHRGPQLRAPHEINGQISPQLSECVLQALALQPDDRFHSASAFAAALSNPQYHHTTTSAGYDEAGDEGGEVETVRIFPLSWKDVERWRAARRAVRISSTLEEEQAPVNQDTAPPADVVQEAQLERQREENEDDQPTEQKPAPVALPITPRPPLLQATQNPQPVTPGWKQRLNGITDLLPAISTGLEQSRRVLQAGRRLRLREVQSKWLAQLKQALLGQQQQVITAAAIVETPLRVLPDQMFTLRIHVVGRNEPVRPVQRRARDGGVEEISLSRLVAGDTVLIEVRSVLQQSHAYLLQRASVTIPAEGYVAEVTIPMQSLTSAPTGRRDRLHIYFMDEHHHPLYEKPFAVEIFVSNHVKRGNEGHHVLTIPL